MGARIVISRWPARFWLGLGLITLAGLAVRLWYALHVQGGHQFGGDAIEFNLLARMLDDRHAYIEPFAWLIEHRRVATAEKPPLYPSYLALWNLVGLKSWHAHLVASSLLGAGSVAAIGAVGRRVAGARAGLIAAALAALYPGLVVLDGSQRSESLYVLLVALALLAAYALVDRPGWRRGALLGLAIGAASLTRSEALALVVLLGLPAVWLALPRGRRLRTALAVCAGCAVLVVPWLGRNWIQFDRPTGISTNEGGLVAGANCPRAYYGRSIGTWACFPSATVGKCNRRFFGRVLGAGACYPLPPPGDRNEAVISSRLRARGLRFARHHAGRVPAVAGVRLLRTWELWDPSGTASIEDYLGDRNDRWNRWAQLSLYAMGVLAAAGAVLLRRRGRKLRLLLALPLLVSIVSVAAYGSSRFRAAAEPALVVLAAVAVEAAALRLLPGREWRAGGGGRD